jgi:hypothetical protein
LSLSKAFSASRVNSNNSSLFVLDSIITSDAMKAANSIGIASVNPKKNKDRQNPANYRGITVTKIFTKIIQSILKSRVDIQIDQINFHFSFFFLFYNGILYM